ncbi:unnamed protein product [Phytomonas sp. Hart1]|nr:unnamed protein product [Phytomonas sp. Hart1]|eukprot:CCW71497.1 unnamed protein product [Phytomonas sp. isolate Hart1]
MSRAFLAHCPRRRLVIHMDLNKTLLQVDPAGGRSVEDVLNSNAAGVVYGVVDDAGLWRPCYGPKNRPPTDPLPQDPVTKGPTPPNGPPALITYAAYVDATYGEPVGMRGLPLDLRRARWAEVTAHRRAATGGFTAPGAVGEPYADLVEEQRRCLGGDGHHIIPAFFKLVNLLSTQDWPFTLIFRTFGEDLPRVLEEWQRFIKGEHKYRPEGVVLQRMRENGIPPRTGSMYRNHEKMYLCLGPSRSISSFGSLNLEKINHSDVEATLVELRKLPNCYDVRQTSFHQLNNELIQFYAESNNVGGLIDYYPAWAQVAEQRNGGKVFPVPFSKREEDMNYYVFFDDNIFIGDERSIVDLRDAYTAESLIGSTLESPFCISVSSYEAITNEDYFIDCLCERLQLQLKI